MSKEILTIHSNNSNKSWWGGGDHQDKPAGLSKEPSDKLRLSRTRVKYEGIKKSKDKYKQ